MPLLSHIFHLFLIFSFLFLNFSSLNSPPKKKKKKKLLFFLLVHTYCDTSSNFSPLFLPLYLLTTLYFTVTLPSSFYLSYILTPSPYLILYKFDIIFPIQSIFFPHKNVSSLSPFFW